MAESGNEEVIGTLVTLMTLEYAPYLLALERVHSAVSKIAVQIEERYKDMGSSATTMARSFYAVAITSAAVAAIVTYAWHRVANSVHEATQASERVGASSEYIRMWGMASQLAGRSADQFANSIESLHKRINDMSLMPPTGVEQMLSGGLRAFTMLGLSPWQMRGMGEDQQLALIADRLSHVTDETLRLQLAQELLGDSAGYMMHYLKNGAAGIEELKQKMMSFNLTLTGGQTRALEESVVAFREMKLAFQGFLTQVSAAAAPMLGFLFVLLRIVGQVLGFIASIPVLNTVLFTLVGALISLTAMGIVAAGVAFIFEAVLIPGLLLGVKALVVVVRLLGSALMLIVNHPVIFAIAAIVLLLLYATGALSKLKSIMGGFIGGGEYNFNSDMNLTASSSMASMETNQILSRIQASTKGSQISAEAMVDLLKQAAPPHMAYSW